MQWREANDARLSRLKIYQQRDLYATEHLCATFLVQHPSWEAYQASHHLCSPTNEPYLALMLVCRASGTGSLSR